MKDTPAWLAAARSGWSNRGQKRPPFAEQPKPGQESVWDYPRPPIIVTDARHVVVHVGEATIADTTNAVRILETASPPTFYIPPADIDQDHLVRATEQSHCEWKGAAQYWRLAPTSSAAADLGRTANKEQDTQSQSVGWSYPSPYSEFASLADWFSFYPGRISCTVDGHVVRPQPGGFYGGWLTDEIVGPVKGGPGTSNW